MKEIYKSIEKIKKRIRANSEIMMDLITDPTVQAPLTAFAWLAFTKTGDYKKRLIIKNLKK